MLTPEEIKARNNIMQGCKIYQIDLNEDIILNSFNSIADASEFMGKERKNATIGIACNATRGSHNAYGYRWYKQKD